MTCFTTGEGQTTGLVPVVIDSIFSFVKKRDDLTAEQVRPPIVFCVVLFNKEGV